MFFKKKYEVVLFECDGTTEKQLSSDILKLQKQTKGNYYDVYTDLNGKTYLIFANFKNQDKKSRVILEMFIHFIYAYIKKGDKKILEEVLFKEKEYLNKNKKMTLRLEC